MKIDACILTAPFEARIERVDADDPGPDCVVIETEYSVISNGTETNLQLGLFPEPPMVYPFAIGYQAAGRASFVGDKVAELKAGDRVFVTINRIAANTNSFGGSHARTIVARASDVLKAPDEVSFLDAAGLVVAQVGYNGGYKIPLEHGPNTIVIGDGMIGQCAAQSAVARGFTTVMIGRHPLRLERARNATPGLLTIDASREKVEERLKERFGGPLDLAIDSVGTPETLEFCYRTLKRPGALVVLGWQGGNQTVNVHKAFSRELTVFFRAGYNRERLQATMDLMRLGKLRIAPLITHTFPAERIGEAYALLKSGRADYLGLAVKWR